MSEVENGAAQTAAPKTIKVSEILADLQNGLTRADIQTKLGLTKKELNTVFQHSKLKNKKTIAKVNINIEDDTESLEASVAPQGAVPETPETTSEEVPGDSPKRGRRSSVATEEEVPATSVPAEAVAEETTSVEPEEIPAQEEDEKSPWDR